MIIANDIKIQQKNAKASECSLLPVLELLFSIERKLYYKGNWNVKKSLEWAF